MGAVVPDIATPLTVALLRAELILLEADAHGLPAAVLEDIRVIERHLHRLCRLVQGLQSCAWPDPPGLGSVSPNEVVAETLRVMSAPLVLAGIDIATALSPNVPPVDGDSTAIGHLVASLLLHACETMPHGGRVLVETAPGPGRSIRLAVSTAGESSPSRDPGESASAAPGVGLTLSRHLVRQAGGTIEVQARREAGLAVLIALPGKDVRRSH